MDKGFGDTTNSTGVGVIPGGQFENVVVTCQGVVSTVERVTARWQEKKPIA